MASYENCTGRVAALMLLALLFVGCGGSDGATGPAGVAGPPGPQGDPGDPGPAPDGSIIIGDGSALTAEEIAWVAGKRTPMHKPL